MLRLPRVGNVPKMDGLAPVKPRNHRWLPLPLGGTEAATADLMTSDANTAMDTGAAMVVETWR